MVLEPSHFLRDKTEKFPPPLFSALFICFWHNSNKYASVICYHGNGCQHQHQLQCSSQESLKGSLAKREGEAGS